MAAMNSHYMSNGAYHNKNNGLVPPKNVQRYNGSLYTMTGSGAQVLMNTQTILTATNMQFLPPIRTNATMCSAASPTTFINALNFSETKMPTNFLPTASPSPSPMMTTTTTIADATATSIHQSTFDACNYGTSTETKTEGYPLFSAIKGFFSNLLRPIISTATTMQYLPVSTDISGNGGGSGIAYATSNGKFHEPIANVYMNVMPVADIETSATFFDCDDYVDSEDTVDFIAGTTPKFDDFAYERSSSSCDLSPKSSAYFDCVSSFTEKDVEQTDALTEIESNAIADKPDTVAVTDEPVAIVKTAAAEPSTSAQREIVSCGLKAAEQCVDKPTYRYRSNNRKRNRRNASKALHRSSKSLAANKNRNEKHRHELEQIIHDDIECIHESASDFDQDENDCHEADMESRIRFDRESVDDLSKHSIPNACDTSAPVPSAMCPMICIEDDAIAGTSKMFSCFISFDLPNVVRKPRPPPKMTPRRLQRWTSSDRPLHYRLSESETDDNFIFVDDLNARSVSADDLIGCDFGNVRKACMRQRQISECSDDFICFEYDENDANEYVYCDDTTDEEFSESDDSDDECSDSDSDVCDFGRENERTCIDNNPPDSGFEEKKVTFNLCPQVHEIRAWKFAYREARKGKWEQAGRDRQRFEKKISELGAIIMPVLTATHREKIYNERFRTPSSEHDENTR